MQPSTTVSVIAGRRYRLRASVLTVYERNGQHVFLRLPAGEVVSVLRAKSETPFVEVKWQSEVLCMFALDLSERAEDLIATIIHSPLSVCA